MQQPFVLIVLLNWNDPEATISAIRSIFQMDYGNFRVSIVDNGSTDDSVPRIRELVAGSPVLNARVELIENRTNAGFTGGANAGLERALALDAAYVWLLNNDATVDAHTLSSLVALAESGPRIGLVSPLIASQGPEAEVVFAGGLWRRDTHTYVDTHKVELARQWAREHPDGGIVFGTALLVPMRVVRAIGLLDDRFFAYYEDADYSIRSLGAGFRNVVDYASTVYHVNKNMARRPEEIRPHYWYYMARNEQLLWRKHLGARGSLRMRWWATNKFIQHYNRVKADPIARQAILAGIWHGWLGRGGAYSQSCRAPVWMEALARIYSRRPALQVTGQETQSTRK